MTRDMFVSKLRVSFHSQHLPTDHTMCKWHLEQQILLKLEI
jgi:hypothetical protein